MPVELVRCMFGPPEAGREVLTVCGKLVTFTEPIDHKYDDETCSQCYEHREFDGLLPLPMLLFAFRPAVMTPVEDRAIDVFAAWLIMHIDDDHAAEGIASLVERFKAELPADWRSRAVASEGVDE